MDYIDSCPPVVIERIQSADLASSDYGGLFSWIANESSLECQVQSVAAVADRLTDRSHPAVVDDFSGSVATYARFLTPESIARIKAAYLRFPYQESIAFNYFGGLRRSSIDIRDFLRTRVVEDWTFTHPRQAAATWHYYMYLAALGEPGALDALARKIAQTEDGNDATNLLQSLSELKSEGVVEVLRRYENDMRRADDPEGPGMTISEYVKIFLMNQSTQ